jgi:hypothetical protein
MIVGLSGYAQSGKDTIANILVEDYGFKRVAFADKIRELLYEMNPDFRDTLLRQAVDSFGWDEVKKDASVRRMMQNLGVGARTIFGDTFWINEAMRNLSYDNNFVFTDVRFINEAEIIKSNHGQVWRVVRPGINPINQHVSESDLDEWPFDSFIENDGSIADLEYTIRFQLAWS